MSSIYNGNIKISIFGESHQEMIGVTIDGLKAGINLDLENIKDHLNRRRPNGIYTTPRIEKDDFKVISGYFNGYTTGTPLTILVNNENINSSSYNNELLRPSHADYTAHVKYKGFEDYRGGGHFSGRITTLIVIVGAICKQILGKKSIDIYSHTKSIKNCFDKNYRLEEIINNNEQLKYDEIGFIDIDSKNKAIEIINKAKENLDSVGGIVEVFATGIEAGIGDPFFDSLESVLSSLFFSVPAVKGVEFGTGFEITKFFGSEVNDSFLYDGVIKTSSNNSGGINGGISNGMPIIANIAVKPTPSIGKEQKTININTLENTIIKTTGRHDPCIVNRARVVLESMMAIGLLDLCLSKYGNEWM